MAKTGFRVTYATLTADNEELHEAYEHGIETARSWLGQKHPFYVNGEERWGDATDEERSPIDNDIVIGHFGRATAQDAEDAIAAAKAFAPEWAATPWQERNAVMTRAADLISERSNEISGADGHGGRQEPARGPGRHRGDGRPHPLLHQADGGQPRVRLRMDKLNPNEHNRSVLRPYGVWAVISPFNFPMALAGGPAGGALVAGNTVVLKPSHQGFFTALKLYEMPARRRRPDGAFHVLTGPGEHRRRRAGREPRRRRHDVHRLVPGRHADLPDVRQGLPEAGDLRDGRQEPGHRVGQGRPGRRDRRRHAVGVRVQRAEVLGVQPRVRAARGVRRVHHELLVEKASKLKVGNPLDRDVFTGPVIDGARSRRSSRRWPT